MIAAGYDLESVARKNQTPKLGPHLKSALWVQEIVKHHGLSQEKFAELADLSRGGLTKLYYGYQRPRFDTLEKLKGVAPPFLKDFDQWEREDHSSMSDPDRTVRSGNEAGGYIVHTKEALTVGEELDSIADTALRRRARNAALNAIEQVLGNVNPSELDADKRPDRAQRR